MIIKVEKERARQYIPDTATLSKSGDFSFFYIFQKENGGLKFAVSKPPFIAYGLSVTKNTDLRS